MSIYLSDDLNAETNYGGTLAVGQVNGVTNDGSTEGVNTHDAEGRLSRSLLVRVSRVLRGVNIELVTSHRRRAVGNGVGLLLINLARITGRVDALCSVLSGRTRHVKLRGGLSILLLLRALLRSLEDARVELTRGRVRLLNGAERVRHLLTNDVAAACCNGHALTVRRAVTNDANEGTLSAVFLLVDRARMLNEDAYDSGRNVDLCLITALVNGVVETKERVRLKGTSITRVHARANDLLLRVRRRLNAVRTVEVAERILCFHNSNGLTT